MREFIDVSGMEHMTCEQIFRKLNAQLRWNRHVRNVCKMRQDFCGLIMAVLAISIWLYLTVVYGQFEYLLVAVWFVVMGCYLILTKRNFWYESYLEDRKRNSGGGV